MNMWTKFSICFPRNFLYRQLSFAIVRRARSPSLHGPLLSFAKENFIRNGNFYGSRLFWMTLLSHQMSISITFYANDQWILRCTGMARFYVTVQCWFYCFKKHISHLKVVLSSGWIFCHEIFLLIRFRWKTEMFAPNFFMCEFIGH